MAKPKPFWRWCRSRQQPQHGRRVRQRPGKRRVLCRRFDKGYVEGNRRCTRLGQPRDQRRKPTTRPGPRSECSKVGLADGHCHHR